MDLNTVFPLIIQYREELLRLNVTFVGDSRQTPREYLFRVMSPDKRFSEIVRDDRLMVSIGDIENWTPMSAAQNTLYEEHADLIQMLHREIREAFYPG